MTLRSSHSDPQPVGQKRTLRDPRNINFSPNFDLQSFIAEELPNPKVFKLRYLWVCKPRGQRQRRSLTIRRASPEDWRMACETLFAPSPFPGSSECEPPSPCWHICLCPRALNLSFSHPFCSQLRLPWLILGIFVATSCQEGLKLIFSPDCSEQ